MNAGNEVARSAEPDVPSHSGGSLPRRHCSAGL